MTREELKSADTRSLISALQYCGRDSYYATYYDEVVDEITKRLNRIAELEKENAELKKKCYKKAVKDYCELEKENAELKDALKGKVCKCMTYLNFKDLEENLTKAKDHIKKLLDCLQQDTNDPQTNYYVVKYMTEAEQFLKECK